MAYFLSFVTLTGLDDVLAENFGLKLSELLLNSPYTVSDLQDKNRKVSLEFVCELLERCREKTGCDHFALLLANKQSLESQGLMGIMANYSGTMGEAINNMLEIVHFNSSGGVNWSQRKCQGMIELSVQIDPEYQGLKTQAKYLAIAKAVKHFRGISNNLWNAHTVYFSSAEPADKSVFYKAFGTNIRFDWDYTGLTFDEKMLALPLPNNDPRVIDLVRNQLIQSGETGEDNFVIKTKKLIRSAMLFEQPISLEAISSKLSKYPRTLQNHLKRQHTSYQELLDQVRLEVASDLLMNSEQSISSISLLVGYSDSSVFSRAFKIRTGQSPLAYRQSSKSKVSV